MHSTTLALVAKENNIIAKDNANNLHSKINKNENYKTLYFNCCHILA